jgi:hypothetical protein
MADRRRFMRALGFAFVAVFAAACAPQSPSAAPSAAAAIPTPSPLPTPSATTEPGPTPLASPSIQCGLPPMFKGYYIIQLNCDGALSAAVAALPPGHPPIRAFLFGWGIYCPPLTPCPTPAVLLETGYVVVTYVDGTAALLIVEGKPKATVIVTGTEALPSVVGSAAELPNPGGTCQASQFVAGPPTSGYDMSTIVSRMATAFQPLTNTGAACVLAIPAIVALAGATGPYTAIGLSSEGQDVCVKSSCGTIYPSSYHVASGASIELSVRAWWAIDLDIATAPPPSCTQPLLDVRRADIPFASGDVEFTWEIPLRQVCPRQARLGITVGGA